MRKKKTNPSLTLFCEICMAPGITKTFSKTLTSSSLFQHSLFNFYGNEENNFFVTVTMPFDLCKLYFFFLFFPSNELEHWLNPLS